MNEFVEARKTKIGIQIKRLMKQYFDLETNKFYPGKTKIPLSVPTFGFEEVYDACESMLTTWVTMGKKVVKFEDLFAKYIGCTNAIMVNSGSSANLLALSILCNPSLNTRITPGSEVITPAVTWSTTVAPIINVGAVPVLVDVKLEGYNSDIDEIEKAITRKTKAIMPVHLLGNPCDMKRIMEVAEAHDLFVIEDACEAIGAELNGKKVGNFGDLATFSFFFSHHITTIEGGMVVTNNEDYAELGRSLRAHGWIRELKNKDKIAQKHKQIDKRFLFTNAGYNLRPTEIQGAFGIHQIRKLDGYIKIRTENADYWNRKFRKYSDFLIISEPNWTSKHVWFGYPITVKPSAPFSREELVEFLEDKGIETRPIMVGNVAEQPFMSLFKHRQVGNLSQSKIVMRHSFFFGNHHAIGKKERSYIADCVTEFVEERTRK